MIANSRLFTVIIVAAAMLCGCASGTWTIDNPYADVDWDTHERHKANLHTHTTMSDGQYTPAESIDRYRKLGYSVLSLTDHDTMGPGGDQDPERQQTTWPWSRHDRDPGALGMVAIQGNEISRVHHIGSYFSDYGNADVNLEQEALEKIGEKNGLAVFFHPGRYSKTVEWYVDMYRNHPHLIGIEIYNQGDRYPNDRKTWDSILTAMMGERAVWGFSNDDMHSLGHIGRNWNVLLLPELSAAAVRRAMEQGVYFFVYAPKGHNGMPPPAIRSIDIDSRKGRIRIEARDYETIDWISGGDIVHQGEMIDLSTKTNVHGYVRAVIHAKGGGSLIGTQPFGIKPGVK